MKKKLSIILILTLAVTMLFTVVPSFAEQYQYKHVTVYKTVVAGQSFNLPIIKGGKIQSANVIASNPMVYKNGKVTMYTTDYRIIDLTAKKGSVIYNYTFVIHPIMPSKSKIGTTSQDNYDIDMNQSITPTASDTSSKIKWYSSNSDIVATQGDGSVIGKMPGKTTICGCVNGKFYRCTVNVKLPTLKGTGTKEDPYDPTFGHYSYLGKTDQWLYYRISEIYAGDNAITFLKDNKGWDQYYQNLLDTHPGYKMLIMKYEASAYIVPDAPLPDSYLVSNLSYLYTTFKTNKVNKRLWNITACDHYEEYSVSEGYFGILVPEDSHEIYCDPQASAPEGTYIKISF